jgi:hypothetical protein
MRATWIWLIGLLLMCVPACGDGGATAEGSTEFVASVASRLSAADVTSVVLTITHPCPVGAGQSSRATMFGLWVR